MANPGRAAASAAKRAARLARANSLWTRAIQRIAKETGASHKGVEKALAKAKVSKGDALKWIQDPANNLFRGDSPSTEAVDKVSEFLKSKTKDTLGPDLSNAERSRPQPTRPRPAREEVVTPEKRGPSRLPGSRGTQGPSPESTGRATNPSRIPAKDERVSVQGEVPERTFGPVSARQKGLSIVAMGSADNLVVVGADGQQVPGSLMRLRDEPHAGTFVFNDSETGQVFAFKDPSSPPIELGRPEDLRRLQRTQERAPTYFGGATEGDFPSLNAVDAEALPSMLSSLSDYADGGLPGSVSTSTLDRVITEFDNLVAEDSAAAVEMLKEAFDGDVARGLDAVNNARAFRDSLNQFSKDVGDSARSVDAPSANQEGILPVEVRRQSPEVREVTVDGKNYFLDDAGYYELNEIMADAQAAAADFEMLAAEARGLAENPPAQGVSIDWRDPARLAQIAAREDDVAGLLATELMQSASDGDAERLARVATAAEGRAAKAKMTEAEVRQAFMGPEGMSGTDPSFLPGQTMGPTTRLAVGDDGDLRPVGPRERVVRGPDGVSRTEDGRRIVEVLGPQQIAPEESLRLDRFALEGGTESTIPPVVGNVRKALADAFRSRRVPLPRILVETLEKRPRSSRATITPAMQELADELEELRVAPSTYDNRKRMAWIRKRLSKMSIPDGADASSATVAAESSNRASQGWGGSLKDFTDNQLNLSDPAVRDAWQRIDPSNPEPPDLTPAEKAARQVLVETYGEAPLGQAIENISTGRSRPELLGERKRTGDRVATLKSRLEGLPQKPGLLSRLGSMLLRPVGDAGVLAPPGQAFGPVRPPAGDRISALQQRLTGKLERASKQASEAGQPLVSPQAVLERINERPGAQKIRGTKGAEDSREDPGDRLTMEFRNSQATRPDDPEIFTGDESAKPVNTKEVDVEDAASDTQERLEKALVKATEEQPVDAADLDDGADVPLRDGPDPTRSAPTYLRMSEVDLDEAEPVNTGAFYVLNEDEAELASALVRGRVPVAFSEEVTDALNSVDATVDLSGKRRVTPELYALPEGGHVLRVGIPVRKNVDGGGQVATTLYLDMDVRSPGELPRSTTGQDVAFRVTSDGSFSRQVRDADKVASDRARDTLRGSMFGMDLETDFGGRKPTANADYPYEGTEFEYDDAPANRMDEGPSVRAAEDEFDPADEFARIEEENARIDKLAEDPAAYDEPQTVKPPVRFGDNVRKTKAELESKKSKATAEEPGSATKRGAPDNSSVGEEAPLQPRSRKLPKRLLLGAGVAALASAGAAYRDDGISGRSVGQPGELEEVRQKLARLRGVRNNPRRYAYGTTQNYAPY